eukprot:CAMPEP_0179438972 /NCGR_PEP_ID=MMETSP0799-20121207/22628_1 /TAXON_ID=46947 /ORGANISM="Geminigera cryophila, Strain CCMP2564" /LENGTH=83 /DNA_ID=CAMNT_0021220969 /DNA_START=1027 /DNA_END=1275 /DNA_ORIENTATION=+
MYTEEESGEQEKRSQEEKQSKERKQGKESKQGNESSVGYKPLASNARIPGVKPSGPEWDKCDSSMSLFSIHNVGIYRTHWAIH